MQIEPYTPEHLEAVVQLSLKAWAPVFESLERVMNADVYRAFYPDHWHASQRKAVEEVCRAEDTSVWLATEVESVVGFIAVRLHLETRLGEIYMVAVEPAFQRCGVGSALIEFALDRMKQAGMLVAMVETGGDPGHAAARHTYEKAGFDELPIARYFKSL